MKERLYLFDTTLRDGQQTPGIDFSLEDKILVAKMLDELGIDYVEGGYPGANPTDTAFFERKRTSRAKFTAFGMVKRAGRSVSNDPGLQDLLERRCRRDLLRRQGLGLPCAAGARLQQRGEPRVRSRSRSPRRSPPVGRRCSTASIFSTATRPIPTTRSPASRRRLAPARAGSVLCDTNGGTLPDEVEADRRRRGRALPARADRHPCPQRYRPGGGELARRGARRRAPYPGDAERHRRALRQCRPDRDHSDAAAEAGLRGAVRDRDLASRAADAHARLARLRRDPEPRAEPPGALCRLLRVRDQGRHPRLRHPEGAGDLRAREAGGGRQPAPRARLRPGGALEPDRRAGALRPALRPLRSAPRRTARRDQGARVAGLCL